MLRQRLDLLGTICGVAGFAFSALAIILRISLGPGNPSGVIVAPRSILAGGTALMVFGCWLKLTAR